MPELADLATPGLTRALAGIAMLLPLSLVAAVLGMALKKRADEREARAEQGPGARARKNAGVGGGGGTAREPAGAVLAGAGVGGVLREGFASATKRGSAAAAGRR